MRRHASTQPQHSHGDTSITNPEGHESYAVKHVIGKGSRSVVHLATCTRGRLKGREVALKIISLPLPSPALESMHIATTALYRSLHHPAFVALHSVFSITDHHYLVLELCEGGTLWDVLNPQSKDSLEDTAREESEPFRLSEAHLRPILRSIIEGLSHLHVLGIIHQDVNTHNIFLTANGRAKLGGFGRTVPASVLPLKSNENPDSAPEDSSFHIRMKTAELQRSVRVDLWSLGCLTIEVLTGIPPSESELENMTKRFDNASGYPRRSKVPTKPKYSEEAEALIISLLSPDSQFPLDNILSLPFFHPMQETQFLDPGTSRPLEASLGDSKLKDQKKAPKLRGGTEVILDAQLPCDTPPSRKEHDCGGNYAGFQTNHTKPRLPYRMPSSLETAMPVLNPALPIDTGVALSSRLESSTAASSGIRAAWTKLTTRQKQIASQEYGTTSGPPERDASVSSPSHPRKVKRKALTDIMNSGHPSTLTLSDVRVGVQKNHIVASGLLSPSETNCSYIPPCGEPAIMVRAPTYISPPSPPAPSTRHASKDSTPIPRTNLPTAFRVPPLFPQTHKLGHGQLVVLPSRSLLVDLREGERRAGGRGEHVMCVSADGQEINVYDAPHLSAPCVLSEPLATWTLSKLPPRYWEAYIFAGKLVESIKKRTPLMVWYTAQAKFTLMSNGPQGDVHATFPCPSPGTRKRRGADHESESCIRMRVVLSRARGTVEVARFTGSEWVTTIGTYPVKAGDMRLEKEREALECVLAALKVCEAAETQPMPGSSRGIRKAKPQESEEIEDLSTVNIGRDKAAKMLHTSKSVVPSSTSGLPLTIAPRPRRTSSAVTSRRVSKMASGPLDGA